MNEWIKVARLMVRTKQRLRYITLLGGAVSLYDVLVLLVRKLLIYDIDQRASAVAYSFTLASFPAVIALFTLIPYIPVAQLDVQIMEFLERVMPEGIFADASATIYDIISKPRSGILSLGFGFALVTATNGMVSLMGSFNVVYHDQENRGFFKTRLVALGLTLLLIAVLLVAVVLLVVGDYAMHLLEELHLFQDSGMVLLVNITRYLTTFLSLTAGITLIYRFAPIRKVNLRFSSIGALFASVLIILTTYIFSIYLSKFSTYNALYGSIGTMIALMIWYYVIALLLIFGFEVNASILSARDRNASIPKK